MMKESPASASAVQEAEAVFIPDEKQPSPPQPVHVATLEVMEGETLFLKGEPQPPAYQDVWFARAFLLQLVGVLVTAVIYIPSALQDTSDDNSVTTTVAPTNTTGDDANPWSLLWIAALLAVLFATSCFTTLGLVRLMTYYAEHVVIWSFFAAPLLLAMWALLLIVLTGASSEGVALGSHLMMYAAIFGLISACLYRAYKPKIPFATSTLQTALAALQVNPGLLLVSLGSLVVAFGWSGIWIMTISGIVAVADAKGKTLCLELYPTATDVYTSTDMCDTDPPNVLAITFLILSLYWTHQVITNIMHCTTSGTVGSWWFCGFGDPSWCSRDVTDSLGRSMTFSLGSICFGSLIVAVLQLLEGMARSARRNRDGALIACLLECILRFIRRWVEYFNSWAFVYVALYGYDYQTAGKNVITLFKNRGWSSFVADRLVFRVLYSVKLVVGICCGGMAALLGLIANFSHMSDSGGVGVLACFYLGALVGLITSSVSLFVIESAVRAVIVCFAESPAEFQEHHPQLCETMRNGWAAAYPEVWDTGDYNERFVKATVLSYEEDHHETAPYKDKSIYSGESPEASNIV